MFSWIAMKGVKSMMEVMSYKYILKNTKREGATRRRVFFSY